MVIIRPRLCFKHESTGILLKIRILLLILVKCAAYDIPSRGFVPGRFFDISPFIKVLCHLHHGFHGQLCIRSVFLPDGMLCDILCDAQVRRIFIFPKILRLHGIKDLTRQIIMRHDEVYDALIHFAARLFGF